MISFKNLPSVYRKIKKDKEILWSLLLRRTVILFIKYSVYPILLPGDISYYII
jgi:hypothetical protein